MLMKWGGKDVYAQAELLVKKGAVKRAEISGDEISGIIAREGASELHTKLSVLAKGDVESHCPCYTHRNQGLVCPHIVALGVTVMLRHSDPLREQKYQEEQRRLRRLAAIDPAAYIRRSPNGTPAELALALSAEWQEEFHAGITQANLFFLVKERIVQPAQVPQSAALALSARDEAILSVLEDICEGPPDNPIDLVPSDFLNIVAIAGGKHIAVSGAADIAVGAGCVETRLQVRLDHDSGALTIAPYSLLPGMESRERPVYLVHTNRGAVYAGGELWPMKNILPLPYHSIYRRDEIIPRPLVGNFLQRDLPVLTRMIPVDMEVAPDVFDFSPSQPAFELSLKGSRASIRATLKALYGGHTFLAGAPETTESFALPDPTDILRYHTRNIPCELKGLRTLKALGFRHQESAVPGEPALTIVGTREVLNFFGSGYAALRREGWTISLSEKLDALFEELPVITPVVHIRQKDEQWFDIGFEYESFDQPNLPPAEIQRALNCGDSFVEVNGRPHLLDAAAVESMRAVFHECQSRDGACAGHFLVPSIYAPYVHSSLRALDGFDIEEPPDWREQTARRNRSTEARYTPFPLGAMDSTLRPYQKEGVYWLRFMEESGFNGILADEMGLGKTLQTLVWIALDRIEPAARGKPTLIICPTSLVENWNREAQKFMPHLRRLVIAGGDRHALFDAMGGADIVITSYALLRRDLDAYRAFEFAAVVLDEAQHIKNRSTQNAIAAKQISARCKLVLTGTPLENSVADIWSIMDFLMPQYLGVYDQFKMNFETPIAGGERDGEIAQAKLRRLLNPFLLRRLKRDVAKDLPEKIVKVSFCQLSPDQARVYSELLADSQRKIKELVGGKGFERSRFEILAMLMKLRQASCHLDLLRDHHTPGSYEAPSAKLEAFLETLDEAIDGGHRMLVFSQFVRFLRILQAELAARGIPCCYLDGATKNRLDECARFNGSSAIPVFLISLKAGGTGLNLTGADMVMHMDPWWNPAVEDQATDRAHRIGQQRTVYSIKLIAEHTVEEKVLEMQRKKQALINATIGASDEALIQKLTFEDIRTLVGL